MALNPDNFSILSSVMSPLQSASHQSVSVLDIEAPTPAVDVPVSLPLFESELTAQMPQHLYSDLLSPTVLAVSDVAQARAVLQTLGVRHDHETVDAARASIADIDATLLVQLEKIVHAQDCDGFEPSAWRAELSAREEEYRAKADAEKLPYKTIIKLDEMHDAYENLLKDAEARLRKIYVSFAEGDVQARQEEDEVEQVNEGVDSIMQEALVMRLEKLDLSGRQLRLFNEAFGKMRGLVSLDVSNNRLEAISDAIAGLEQLQELHLSSNLLMSLPDSIGLLLNLKILDVSSNKLKTLPDSISHCRSLVELNASYNELTYLPTNLGYELVNLQKLLIYLNKLRSLPTSICEMRSLRLLDAHFNELHGLPYSFGNLANLETLNLSSNFSDMKELPPTFGDLSNLQELDLSNNQIHALPDSFGHLNKLSKLNLDHNPLIIPPADIVNQGIDSVRQYMRQKWLDMLIDKEQKKQTVESPQSNPTWLTYSASWINNFAAGFSRSFAEYLGTGEKSYRDPCLDQQL